MPTASPTRRYDAIILAGHSGQPNALTQGTGEPRKALLPIRGRPMVSYVLSALLATGCLRRLVLVGLSRDEIPQLEASVEITFLPNGPNVVDNALRAIAALGTDEQILFCGTDLPLLSAEAVLDFIRRAEESGADICYPIVSRDVMEARFPGSGRSYRPMAEGPFAGGDVSLMSPEVIRRNAPFFLQMTASRKNAPRLAAMLGLGFILRYLTHRLRISDVERRVGEILGCTCRAIISPYAEIAMDVDKPQHLEVARRALQAADEAAGVGT